MEALIFVIGVLVGIAITTSYQRLRGDSSGGSTGSATERETEHGEHD